MNSKPKTSLFALTVIAGVLLSVSSFAGNAIPGGDKDKAKKEEADDSAASTADPATTKLPMLTIEPPLNTDELSIIPNPANAQFRFSYYMPGVRVLSIKLEDEVGNVVHSMEIGGHEEMYNLPFKFWEFPDGVYYLEVQTDFKTFKRRIVKANYND